MTLESDEHRLLPPMIEEEVEESEEQLASYSEPEFDLFSSEDANDSEEFSDLDLGCVAFPNTECAFQYNTQYNYSLESELPPLDSIKFDWSL